MELFDYDLGMIPPSPSQWKSMIVNEGRFKPRPGVNRPPSTPEGGMDRSAIPSFDRDGSWGHRAWIKLVLCALRIKVCQLHLHKSRFAVEWADRGREPQRG